MNSFEAQRRSTPIPYPLSLPLGIGFRNMVDSPSLSIIDHLPTKVDAITKGSQTPNIDRTIRVAHANKYPLQVWYFLASFIFLITLFNITGLGLGYYRDRRNRRSLGRTPEAQNLRRGSASLLRLPHALADTFKAISFRWTISIGQSYTLNLAEVVLTAIYISICFAWALINSEYAFFDISIVRSSFLTSTAQQRPPWVLGLTLPIMQISLEISPQYSFLSSLH